MQQEQTRNGRHQDSSQVTMKTVEEKKVECNIGKEQVVDNI